MIPNTGLINIMIHSPVFELLTYYIIQSSYFFSKPDFCRMYNWEGDEWKIDFQMTNSHYEYLGMPCGLVNAPSVFQVLNYILRDVPHRSWSVSVTVIGGKFVVH